MIWSRGRLWVELLVPGTLDNLGRDWSGWYPTIEVESLWLRVEVVWPLEALVGYVLVYSLRSHIHAWNMAHGWLVEREIWFNPIYGRVLRGSLWLGWYFHLLIRDILLQWFMYNCSGYIRDIMVEFPWFMCWLCYGYILIIWCVRSMDIVMNYLVVDWLMNVWTNKCCCNYVERA